MKGKSMTFRPKADLRQRIERLCEVTERPYTYWLEKAIEAHLPALEKQYAKELKEIADKAAKYPARPDIGIYVAEQPPKKKAG